MALCAALPVEVTQKERRRAAVGHLRTSTGVPLAAGLRLLHLVPGSPIRIHVALRPKRVQNCVSGYGLFSGGMRHFLAVARC
jgi:hypothetical protein